MFECRESDSIVAASFNAGMTMAAFILTVAVKFYELNAGANRLSPWLRLCQISV